MPAEPQSKPEEDGLAAATWWPMGCGLGGTYTLAFAEWSAGAVVYSAAGATYTLGFAESLAPC